MVVGLEGGFWGSRVENWDTKWYKDLRDDGGIQEPNNFAIPFNTHRLNG